jgi:hypothetical protein
VRVRSNNSRQSEGRASKARRSTALAVGAGLALVVSTPSSAQESLDAPLGRADEGAPEVAPPEPDVDPSAPPTEAQPDVGLDQLLRLPNSLDFKEERRGGGGAADWRRRFSESRRSVSAAKARVAETEAAMAEAGVSGSGQWQIAPPGQQASAGENGPLNFKLREDLRRAREALEEAARRHRALAGGGGRAEVPEAWRAGA